MKHVVTRFVVVLILLAPAAPAFAQQRLDPASTEALGTVLRMLANPAQRGAAVAADPQASAADARIRALAGDKLMEEFYGLAGQIFEDLTRASGGDVSEMSEALSRAQSDPAAFAAMLSPATLAKLQAFAAKMSDQKR